jgi:hypothetical protein
MFHRAAVAHTIRGGNIRRQADPVHHRAVAERGWGQAHRRLLITARVVVPCVPVVGRTHLRPVRAAVVVVGVPVAGRPRLRPVRAVVVAAVGVETIANGAQGGWGHQCQTEEGSLLS